MEVQVCLKKSSFPEPLRDIERRHEIRFYERALDRLGNSEEAPCGLRRSRRRRCAGRPCCRRIEFGTRQTQKASGSSATSRKSMKRQLSRITSRRSPYSAEAASVQCPAAPGPDSGPL